MAPGGGKSSPPDAVKLPWQFDVARLQADFAGILAADFVQHFNTRHYRYLNVNLPHRVAHRGAADRIHLVIDCVVNDWLREQLLAAARP
jgi:hypothetical protein